MIGCRNLTYNNMVFQKQNARFAPGPMSGSAFFSRGESVTGDRWQAAVPCSVLLFPYTVSLCVTYL